jgi:hypothetical protein
MCCEKVGKEWGNKCEKWKKKCDDNKGMKF